MRANNTFVDHELSSFVLFLFFFSFVFNEKKKGKKKRNFASKQIQE
jgi:hypothetical protein